MAEQFHNLKSTPLLFDDHTTHQLPIVEMVWFRAKVLQVFARPVLIPISVGAFGLWYGTYNITYQGTSFLGNAILGSSTVPIPSSTKLIASGCGVTCGITAWYIIKTIYPTNWVSPASTFQYRGIHDIGPMIKNSITSLKQYPVLRLYSLVLFSGGVSGLSKTIFERIFYTDLK